MIFGAILLIAAIVAAVVVTAVVLAKALSNAGNDADENFSSDPVDATHSSCPVICPESVEIFASDGTSPPCQLLPVNGSVQLRATVLPEGSASHYLWTSTSSKIRIDRPDAETIMITALAEASSSLDAETLQVQCTSDGCSPVTANITLSVIKVTFSKSASQKYGYDNMDTAADTSDDHVSVKKLDDTVIHTLIEGGLNGLELDFVCEPENIAAPVEPPASAEFDLTVNGENTDKGETLLTARLRCQCSDIICGSITINTYKEKPVEATVAKVHDSTVPATALRFPNLDVASTATLINTKYKAGVATMTLSDHSPTNGAVDVRYDLDGNGKLTYDIVNRGGAEFNAITTAVAVAGWRVVTVRDMVSVYFLAAAAAVGDTTITINTAGHFYRNNDTAPLGTGATRENVTIQSFAGAVLTLAAPLTKVHASDEPLEFPAAGWSGNPVVIIEGAASEDELKWTIAHELGHSALRLADVTHTNSVMHFQQGAADHRLRYKPLPKHYSTGEENQWETIPR